MTKSTKTTKTSAIFLATVLVAGIIALSSPSFMIGAEAAFFDNNNHKSFGKDVSVKYVKCNNINVNINGVEFNVNSLPGLFGSEVAAVEEEVGSSSFGGSGGNNGPSGFDNKGVVFVCINNNDNGGKDVDREKTCKGCLLQALGFQGLRDFIQYLSTLPPTAANDLQEYCDLIQSEIERGDTRAQVQAAIQADLTGAGITLDATELADLVDCLFEVFGDETNTR